MPIQAGDRLEVTGLRPLPLPHHSWSAASYCKPAPADRIAPFADGRASVAGERPSIADCTLAAALNFGRVNGYEREAPLMQIARWEASWEAAHRARAPALAALGS
jgi:hypothetical protein